MQKWTNITNRHVAEVVASWRKQGLKPGTIKNYLASIRAVCRAYGNDDIHADNDAFGVERRVYVTFPLQVSQLKVRDAGRGG